MFYYRTFCNDVLFIKTLEQFGLVSFVYPAFMVQLTQEVAKQNNRWVQVISEKPSDFK